MEHDSVTIVIGAMVIAPLLGPNVALALATTLGDLPLAKQAGLSAIAGIATVTLMTLIIGALLHVYPTMSQLASRTHVEISDVVLALAAGCAGALASENASRLAAMQRAEKNIDELQEDLKQNFHRLRQNSIDEELFDVVSGFEALKTLGHKSTRREEMKG